MADSQAQLLLDITANINGLKQQLNTATQSINGFANSSKQALLGIGEGLLAAFSFKALNDGIQATINTVDELQNSADKLGITVESFQNLAFAAKISDVELGKLESNMSRLQKTLGDAAGKGFEVGSVFDKLGLNVQYLNSLSPDKQFLAVAAALNKVQNQAQKVSLGTQLFGKGFRDIIPLLKQDFPTIQKQFDKLNASLSGQEIGNVSALDDTQKRLSTVFTGVGQQIVAELAPAYNTALKGIEDYITASGGARNISLEFGKVAVASLQAVAMAFTGIYTVITQVIGAVDKLISSFSLIQAELGQALAKGVLIAQQGFGRTQEQEDKLAATFKDIEGNPNTAVNKATQSFDSSFSGDLTNTTGNLFSQLTQQLANQEVNLRNRQSMVQQSAAGSVQPGQIFTDGKGNFGSKQTQELNIKLEIRQDGTFAQVASPQFKQAVNVEIQNYTSDASSR